MIQTTPERKKSFSSFTYKEACKQLGIAELQRWSIIATPVPISDFFRQRLERLQRFDLESLEVSKSLLYGIGEMSILLGLLRVFFGYCQQNLG
jgi:hypothetical protein